MSNSDADDLLEVLIPFAKDQLRRRGGFIPFGASIANDGNLRLTMVGDGDDLDATEQLRIMRHGLREQAAESEIRASGVCWDAVVTTDGKRTDAIGVHLEDNEGSVEIYIPYSKRFLRGYEYGEMLGSDCAPQVFA